MKLIKSAMLLATASLLAINANAENKNFYITGSGGYSNSIWATDDFNDMGNAGVYGFAAGYQFNEKFRTDLGFEYRGNYTVKDDDDVNNNIKAKLKSYSVMLTGYYDIMNYNGFTPFVGLGMGWAQNKTSSSVYYDYDDNQSFNLTSSKENNFSWKFIAGAKYAINESIDVLAQYQFADMGYFRTKSGTYSYIDNEGDEVDLYVPEYKGKLRTQEIMLGVSYKF